MRPALRRTTGLDHDRGRLELFLSHRAALVDYATPIVGCRARAEDIVQESYLRFANPRAEEDALRQPVAYLYRIVRNLAFDCVRRLAAESRRDDSRSHVEETEPLAPSPEEVLIHRDELKRIDAALAGLPDRTRLAFELHRFGGLTFQQIAERLGVSVATAHRLTRDAMVRVMRSLIEPDR